MDRTEAEKSFRRIYPEKEVRIRENSEIDKKHNIIEAAFPDGTFWFAVSDRMVSASYNSRSEVVKDYSRKYDKDER